MSRSRSLRFLRQICWSIRIKQIAALVLLSVLPGCLLLDWSLWWNADGTSTSLMESSQNVLAKIPTSRTAVTLEIIFVERPVDDPLMGDQLWNEVDQIGMLDSSEQESLEKLGFRVGRVGAHPPQALQTLMGLATEIRHDDDQLLTGRRVVLPSGAETEVNTGLAHWRATLNIPKGDDQKPVTFENIRGVFRLKAKQLQEGWARVEFLPEVHHGALTNRPVAVRGGWQVQTSQAIERFYKQRFSLDLNVGEMVILTGNASLSDSLGRHFFFSSEITGKTVEELPSEAPVTSPEPEIQRLLIVRLANLSVAKPLYSE